MSSYALSKAADADIEAIARASVQQWGFTRSEAYVLALHRAFEHLAQFPGAGRDVSDLRPGYRRFEHESHSIFYRKAEGGILVMRVLHQRMQPRRHL